MSARAQTVNALYRDRPRSRFVSGSVAVLVLAMATAWLIGDASLWALFTERSQTNLTRFLGELWPHFGWEWFANTGRLHQAVWPTLALSVCAIALAGFVGALLSVGASRRLIHPDPDRQPLGWALFGLGCRTVLMLMRAIPAYLWAFLLILVFGLGAWPAVLALALHNAGILGKLTAEVIDDLEPGALRALRGLGAKRPQLALIGVYPQAFNRFLLFFFVRWETAVREATVLGLLGFVSVGWFIQDARARMHYDEMVLFVLVGSAIIVIGDGVSIAVRAKLR